MKLPDIETPVGLAPMDSSCVPSVILTELWSGKANVSNRSLRLQASILLRMLKSLCSVRSGMLQQDAVFSVRRNDENFRYFRRTRDVFSDLLMALFPPMSV
jgi:hypothetical protein